MAENATSSNVGVFYGDGDGSFDGTAANTYTGATYAWGLAVGDFNHDGVDDLAVSSHRSESTGSNLYGILLGNSNGTFNAVTNYVGSGGDSCGITTYDFDGDGVLDIGLADFAGNKMSVFLGEGEYR